MWFGKFKINTDSVKEIIKYGLPFVPTFLITWIFQSFDKLALRNYCDFTEIGLYSAAFKVVSVMSLIQVGFSNFWTPVSYESYENDPESTGLFEKVSLFISAAMFVVGMLIIVFKDVIFLLLAKSYRQAAGISSFLLLIPIMNTTSQVTGVGIGFKKKTYWHMIISAVPAVANVIGNTLLVPQYGAKGAAFTTGLSYILYYCMKTFISKNLYPVNYHLGKFFTATVVFVIVAFINTFVGNLVWQVLSAVIGLVIVLLVYNTEVKYALDLVIDELKRVITPKKSLKGDYIGFLLCNHRVFRKKSLGVKKKILGQVKAFESFGFNVSLIKTFREGVLSRVFEMQKSLKIDKNAVYYFRGFGFFCLFFLKENYVN